MAFVLGKGDDTFYFDSMLAEALEKRYYPTYTSEQALEVMLGDKGLTEFNEEYAKSLDGVASLVFGVVVCHRLVFDRSESLLVSESIEQLKPNVDFKDIVVFLEYLLASLDKEGELKLDSLQVGAVDKSL
ncbi:hypothetical protein [Vibrio alginolyticus]|uniref:hypothetical protein n=1 Tax=Vibrio TaxID=662 RepID=UPI0006CA937C|nr:hypothetical protein [Vibrio alginolyticus]KPM97443.1 hypothetical protein AOG25_13275 [Vibrio alginolyticus]CAH7182707.1 conserved hypothetical protein [Vibrio chagasii]CAH7351925.1 conserved hypothetical protein [Vibrio chagasii]